MPVLHHVSEHRIGSPRPQSGRKIQSLADKAIAHSLDILVGEQLSCIPLFHLAGAEEEGGHVQHEEAVPPGALRLQP